MQPTLLASSLLLTKKDCLQWGGTRHFTPELTVLLSPSIPQEDNCRLRGLLLLHPVSADLRPAGLINTQEPQEHRQLTLQLLAAAQRVWPCQESPARRNRPFHPVLFCAVRGHAELSGHVLIGLHN